MSAHAVDMPTVVARSSTNPKTLNRMFGSQMANAAGNRRLNAMPSSEVKRM